MEDSKFCELNDVKEWLESQAYVRGLDEDECSSLLKDWFKWGQLRSRIFHKLEIKEDSKSKKIQEKISLINSILSELEDILREVLSEHAQELEQSREKVQKFVVGLGIGHYLKSGSVEK
jgi:vacuolar-type H+-ATPase subunit I/STV1